MVLPSLIDLTNNTIYIVNPACQNISNLETLILKQNKLRGLHDQSFGQCPQLKKLDLSYNHLSTKVIAANTFHGLSKLTTLNLSNNPMELLNFSRNTFRGLSYLHNIDISHCKFKRLEANFFNGLDKLDNLSLENNEIAVLVSHTFSETKELRTLKLQKNVIKEIQPQALTGLNNLVHLDLQYNQLSTFPPTYTDKTQTKLSCRMSETPLSKLQKLYLGHNKISVIQPCAFELFPNLKESWLNDNLLSELPSDIFYSVSKLAVLNLANNWFKHFDGIILQPLINLTQFNISYNQLENFNPKEIMFHLNHLRYFGIAGNYVISYRKCYCTLTRKTWILNLFTLCYITLVMSMELDVSMK